MNRSIVFLLLLMIMITYVIGIFAGRNHFSENDEIQINRYLKQFNKPALKSIESSDGDTIDCVSITDQPAFDHPLLKNHTIQMRPSFHPEGAFRDGEASSESIAQLWHENGECPENTIPIRRTKREDLLRAYSIEQYGKKSPRNVSGRYDLQDNQSGHEYAIVYLKNGDKFHGATATLNVWKPKVQERSELSLGQIWIFSDSPNSELNTLEAGWQVSQIIYGDSETRFFIYWTSDGYQSTGCYNTRCPGFVQVDHTVALGGVIKPVSTYNGDQYEVPLLIFKDRISGNWWLTYGKTNIGYWPSTLVPKLADSAGALEWGGEVLNLQTNGQHTSTEMGSGHFPEEKKGKASYFSNIQVVDMNDNLIQPQGLEAVATRPSCYNVNLDSNDDWGVSFFYGGPGRNPSCP